MAAKIFQTTALVILLTLVVMGLNICNQGINQLSGESRPPVVYLQLQNDVLKVDWLGSGYTYPASQFIKDLVRFRDTAAEILYRTVKQISHFVKTTDYNLLS